VPFLPLEREHVRNCIRAEFRNYKISAADQLAVADGGAAYQVTDYDIEQIVDEHVFEPPGYKKYSSSGCKRVPFLVRTFISKRNFKLNEDL
jgi:hypothetical protein